MPRSARFLALASLAAMLLASPRARAQAISASGQIYPNRIVGGANLGPSTRAQNLNPFGINYLDCTSDMTLEFNLLLSNFDGSQLVQVWAGTADCTSDVSRGLGMAASCWLVGQPIAGVIAGAAVPLRVDVRVQDIVGHLNSVPQMPAYVPVGAAACQSQTVDTAQSFTLFFLPTDSSGHAISSSSTYKYAVKADLVGPPPPTAVSIADGDTLFVVNWTANSDADTAGYDVYIDPVPGQEGVSSGAVGAEPVLVCVEGGTSTAPIDATVDAGDASIADATADTGDDGSVVDAVSDAPGVSDASTQPAPVCVYQTSGGAIGSSTCGSFVLSGSTSTILDGSTAVAAQVVDEAGNVIEGGTTSGVVGISNIPPAYLLNSGPTGVTVSDKATGSFTISGLKNGTTYNVVVAAVDGSGNVGPPSQEVCDFPAPVNDFWNLYRADGGQAGGGLCALEAIGEPVRSTAGLVLAGATCALVLRRRRKSK